MLTDLILTASSALASVSDSLSDPLDFLFRRWSYQIAGRDVFERDFFQNQIELWFKIGLALLTAGLLMIAARARRLGESIPERTVKRVSIALTVLGFFIYFDFFNPNVRYHNYYHRHELFHYYLGSKYSDEVGYTRLYECASIAEVELGRGDAIRKREIRDLSVNLIKPTVDTAVFKDPAHCKKHFAKDTWEAFKKDVAWFERTARGSYWENMQKDHGYNPPPVWTMQGKFFSSFGVAGDGFFKMLSTLDILLHVATLAMLGWAFGYRVMAVAAVFWGCNAPANFYWTGGAFLRQDWVFFFVASVCFARKRMFSLAGGALTWSALLRVFPLIGFAGWGIMVAIHLWRKRTLHPDHRKLIGGCIVAAGILIPSSMVVAGPDSYREFISHISVHKNTPLTNHMGLETILSHNWDGRMRFTRDNTMDDPFEGWKNGRRERFHALRPLFLGITAVVFGWTFWALRRTKLLWVGVPLSIPLIICLTNLTCYYYCMFLPAAALMLVRPSVAPTMLVVAGASQILLRSFYFIDDKYTAQSYLFFTFSLLLLWVYSRPFSVERLKTWIEGKPEPKTQVPLGPRSPREQTTA